MQDRQGFMILFCWGMQVVHGWDKIDPELQGLAYERVNVCIHEEGRV